MKMESDRLIKEIHKRPPLWNQKHPLYHNRDLTNRMWTELSTMLNAPKDVLKAKWKGLRDTFRAEIKKEQIYRNKSKHRRSRSVWVHYKSLDFLRDQMNPRAPIWERNNAEPDSSSNKNDEIDDNNSDNAKCNKSERKKPIKLKIASTAVSTLRKSDSLDDRLLQSVQTENIKSDLSIEDTTIKQEPIDSITCESAAHQVNDAESLNDNEMLPQTIPQEQVLMNSTNDTCNELSVHPLETNRLDDNYHFLMSLLPHIKSLSAERQMLLRIQMQELVYKEVYRKNSDKNC